MPNRPAIRPIADVDGDRDAELAGQLPLRLHDLVLGEPRAAGGERHREQPVVARHVRRPHPSYVVAGDRLCAEEPVLLQRRVGAAVGVLRPDPGLLQALDRGVGVLGGVVDVRPVDQRGDAGVEALQRPGQVAGVDVLGPVERCEGVEHLDEVVVQGRVRRAVADRRLPGVPVGVDEARDDDLARAVDDLGVGLDGGLDADDLVVLDQHVAGGPVPDVRVHRQDGAALEEDLAHGVTPFCPTGRPVAPVVRTSTTRDGVPPRRPCRRWE